MFDSLHFDNEELIAITGCGGKTSLMSALSKYFRGASSRVIVTTTTKIGVPRDMDNGAVLVGSLDENRVFLQRELEKRGVVTIARGRAGEKLTGFACGELEALWRERLAPYLLAECDGSRGLSFKAYASHEPVVPQSATVQFVVIGAEIFMQPADEKIIFRCELFEERNGPAARYSRNVLSRGALIDLLESEREFLKNAAPKAKKILLVNKCERLSEDLWKDIAESLARGLRRYDEVMLVSLKQAALYERVSLRRAAQ